MNRSSFLLRSCLVVATIAASGLCHALAEETRLTLTSPVDYQVVQRSFKNEGLIKIRGSVPPNDASVDAVETKLTQQLDAKPVRSKVTHLTTSGDAFSVDLEVPAGGWYRLDVRVTCGDAVFQANIDHVGVGEVFVVAGQSNSANYGEEKQSTSTGLVSAFDGKKWRLAQDPEPGAGGKGGSFMPPLGDLLAKEFHVPIGFAPCGIGATSVREWLPAGVPFPNPPTITQRVHQLPNGPWESDGRAFQTLAGILKTLGPEGCRAVLWHQGESDANQKDPTRTLSGALYQQYLTKIILETRREAAWRVTWLVAQASYHGPDDQGSPEIREAQAAVVRDKLALPGPDTDQLKSEYREKNGQGVHFTGPGLREHARLWSEKILHWQYLNP